MKRLWSLAGPAVGTAVRRRPLKAFIAFVALAVPLAVFGAPLAANAAGNHLCETSGNYCVGAPSATNDAAVVETATGRDITLLFLGNAQYELQLTNATSLCVAAANNGVDVVLHHCNGGSGVVWILVINPNGHLQWLNRLFNKYLAGHNNGTQFHIKDPAQPGWFYNFDQV